MTSTLGGWLLALRIARREALHHKAQTALMLVLICLPVLAVSAAAVAWQTSDISAVERLDRELGSADALVTTEPGGPVVQHFDPRQGVVWPEGRPGDEPAATFDDVRRVLGDRPAITVRHHGLAFESDLGRSDAMITEVDLGDPLAKDLFRPVSGDSLPGRGEVVVNAALVERGPEVGEDLVLVGEDGEESTLRIVGIAESARIRSEPVAVVAPGALTTVDVGTTEATDDGGASRAWLVGGGPVTWDQVRDLNRLGAAVTSRAVITDPPPDSELPQLLPPDNGIDQTTLTAAALIVTMVLLEVVLLAGPAFAVRARKQAHVLALIAAVGGTPAQSRRVVLATGVVVGLLGGVVGASLGVAVGLASLPLVQRLNPVEQLGPFDVPWRLLAGVSFFGLVSAVTAAVVPAVIAARQDVVAVLAGRRGEGRPSYRSPLIGLVLLGLGIAGAVAGSRAGDVSPVLVGGSAILSVVAAILLVPVVVTVIARLAARLPLPLRFAARDAARHRTRTVPAVAAVAATVAGVVALGIAVESQEADQRSEHEPQLPLGQGVVALAPEADLQAVRDVLTHRVPQAKLTSVTGVLTEYDGEWLEVVFRAGGDARRGQGWSSYGASFLVGSRVPDLVEMSPADRRRANRVLAEGGVVLLRGVESPPEEVSELSVVTWKYRETEERPEKVADIEVPAVSIAVSGVSVPADAVVPASVVKDLGLESATTGLVIDGGIPEDAEKDLDESLSAMSGQPRLYVERGYQPDPTVRIVQLILGALGAVLMLGGTLTATFLALSDARPDLSTMAAVGARPRTRRGVAAAYALLIGVVGAGLGTPVGFIPGMAISRPITRDLHTGVTHLSIPWLLIGVVVVGIPLFTAAAVGLCARSRLPMVARIE